MPDDALLSLPERTDAQIMLRLLATSDLHARLHCFDYYRDEAEQSYGLAGLTDHIAHARATQPNCLLFDNGDFLSGNPLGDWAEACHIQPHPVIAAMNQLRYDGAALGNHEFNHPPEQLSHWIDAAEFPILCANLHAIGPQKRLAQTSVILERSFSDANGQPHILRLGLIGLVPEQIAQWDRRHLEGRFRALNMLDCALREANRLRALKVDLIIGLAHTGVGQPNPERGAENIGLALAESGLFDALILGHSHELFPDARFKALTQADLSAGTLAQIPCVLPGFWGSHLGQIDLTLAHSPQGWRVQHSQTQLLAAQPPAPSTLTAAFLNATAPAHEATRAYMDQGLGALTTPLHSFFSLIHDCPALQLVAEAQRAFIAQALSHRSEAQLPILSAVAPFKAGGRAGILHYVDIPAGPLAARHLAQLYAFNNSICAVEVSAKGLHDWLERSAALYHEVQIGGEAQPLLSPDFPSYNYDVIIGIEYEIDLSRPALAGRIRNLRYQGRAITPDQRFIVASNDYRLNTTPALRDSPESRLVFEAPYPIRSLLQDHLRALSPLTPQRQAGWRFCPHPATSVLFDTNPAAIAYLGQIAHLAPSPEVLTENGALRLRLQLDGLARA